MSIAESLPRQERSFAPFRSSRRSDGDATPRPVSRRRVLWSHLVAGFFILASGLFVSGLTHLRAQSYGAWIDGLSDFKWLVFVEGDQVQMDEVGRYLRQLDAVESVSFVSAQTMLNAFQSSSLVPPELQTLSAEFIPSAWEVQWAADPKFQTGDLYGLYAELNALPGVADIAFDVRDWQDLQKNKERWLVFRLVLASVILSLIVALSIFFARLFFFTPLTKMTPSSAAGTIVNAFVWWTAGVGIAWFLFGPIPLVLLAGGVLAGAIHVVARLAARDAA